MLNKILASPTWSRVAPFAVFAALTLLQQRFGDASQYWIYALKTAVGAGLLWLVRKQVNEMRWKFSWESVIIGIAVFGAWVGLDGCYPMLAERPASFNPNRTYGAGSTLAASFIGVRIIGSSLVVPLLEEVFYRSFLYRFIIKSQFLQVPLHRFDLRSFVLVAAVFGFGHYEWLPGILCAFAYQGLVCRKGRLGDAITAHAITNFLLALWVVARNDYRFW